MKILKARLKRAMKRLAKHQSEMDAGRHWEEEAHVAELLQSNLYRIKKGMKEIEVEDWNLHGQKKVLKLNPLKEPAEQLQRQWKLSRKLRNKLFYATQFTKSTAQEIEELQVQIRQEAALAEKPILPKVIVPKEPPPIKRRFREFKTERGITIFIGKGAANNEELTFSFANGLDLWLHVANHPGCHVVMRAGKEVDDESLQDALQLALFFSKVQEDEITVAECKNLKKIKGAKKGQVSVGKHRTIFARQNPDRLERIFQRASGSSLKR